MPVLPDPARALSRAAAPLGVLGLLAAAFGYVGAVDPHRPGHYPACPVLALTGLYCPGCGGLRSAHAVAHGDLAGAVGANALAVAGYAVAAGFLLRWLVQRLRDRPSAPPPAPPPFAGAGAVAASRAVPASRTAWLWAALGLALAFTVLRNLPPGAVLAP